MRLGASVLRWILFCNSLCQRLRLLTGQSHLFWPEIHPKMPQMTQNNKLTLALIRTLGLIPTLFCFIRWELNTMFKNISVEGFLHLTTDTLSWKLASYFSENFFCTSKKKKIKKINNHRQYTNTNCQANTKMYQNYEELCHLVFGEDENIPGGQVSVDEPFALQVAHAVTDLLSEVTESRDGEVQA